jgi:ribulose 1,5-bisphosphate carboxylase large subunit-like protein
MSTPKKLTSKADRQIARNIRNAHWRMMERINEHGTLWFCVWNKIRRNEGPDEMRCGLLDGMEQLQWIKAHPEWFVEGEWDEARYALPLQLTDAGREALQNRAQYDMEPVEGGLVEPGWICTPLESSNERPI